MTHLPPSPNGSEQRMVTKLTAIERELAALRGTTSTGGASVALPFTAGWKNYEGGFAKAGYSVTSAGRVFLRGLVTPTAEAVAGGTNDAIAFLPEGFRPAESHVMVAYCSGVVARVDIYNTGSVSYISGPTLAVSGSSYLSLEGMSFLIGT